MNRFIIMIRKALWSRIWCSYQNTDNDHVDALSSNLIGYINFHPCIAGVHQQNTHIFFFTEAHQKTPKHTKAIWPENWK